MRTKNKIGYLLVKVLSLLTSIVLTVQVYAQKVNQPMDVKVKISLDKTNYYVLEPIWLHMKIINNTKEAIEVDWIMLRSSLRILSDKEKEVPQYFHISTLPPRAPGIEPGDSMSTVFNIVDYYGTEGYGLISWRLIHPGYYKIYSRLPQLSIMSNEIAINVFEPKDGESKALSLLLEGMKLSEILGSERKTAKAKAYDKFEELVQNYPHSIYAPKALIKAAGCYLYDQSEKGKARRKYKYRELIDKYPKSLYVPEAFGGILGIYSKGKDKDGAIKEMQALIKEYPNTDISKRAESAIKVIQEKW